MGMPSPIASETYVAAKQLLWELEHHPNLKSYVGTGNLKKSLGAIKNFPPSVNLILENSIFVNGDFYYDVINSFCEKNDFEVDSTLNSLETVCGAILNSSERFSLENFEFFGQNGLELYKNFIAYMEKFSNPTL